MACKKFFLLFLVLTAFWVFFFRLKPNQYFLVINFKQLTPVSPLYYLKTAREGIQSLFIMGDRDSSEWYFTLAQKRAVEAQVLCRYHLNNLAARQSVVAGSFLKKAIYHLDKLIGKTDVNYLLQMKQNSENLLSDVCK